MTPNMRQGNSQCDTIAEALAPIVALVDALTGRVDQLERDLSAARLRNDRMRTELLAMEGALGGAQTLIAAGIQQVWECAHCGTVVRDGKRSCTVCGVYRQPGRAA
jgi:rubrerythrin